jgi:hypothetical protein
VGLSAAALAALVAAAAFVREPAPPPAPAATAPAPLVKKTAPGPPPLPGNVQVLGFSVKGRLTYDGRPLEEVTDRPARFWLRHEGRGEVQPGIVSYRAGQFTLSALPGGRIGAQVTVDLNPAYPAVYPGDLYRWKTFEVGAGAAPPLEIDLLKVIRLRAPQDNGAPLPGWGEDCSGMFVAGRPRFEWEAPEAGLTYDYSVARVECPYVARGIVAHGATTETALTLSLPASAPNEFYVFDLHGRRGDRQVALITTHGLRGGLGWDYRFRLR